MHNTYSDGQCINADTTSEGQQPMRVHSEGRSEGHSKGRSEGRSKGQQATQTHSKHRQVTASGLKGKLAMSISSIILTLYINMSTQALLPRVNEPYFRILASTLKLWPQDSQVSSQCLLAQHCTLIH